MRSPVTSRRSASVALVLLAPCGVARAQAPNQFFTRGTPTLVRGTAGDERTDQALAAQAELVRGQCFPGANVVEDRTIDVAAGKWPPNPVLFGSDVHNAALVALHERLPFRFQRNALEIAGRSFTGSDVRLIACVPAEPDTAARKGWPEFVVYAGVGPLDALELNSVRHGESPLLVVDRFGPLVAGAWKRDAKGRVDVLFGPASKRETWRRSNDVERANPRPVFVQHLERVPATPADTEHVAACLRGVERTAARLHLASFDGLSIYVYPDKKTKELLTANGADGHADVASRSLHVLACDAQEGGALENLVAHEATHVLMPECMGPAACALLGEGLAVWASGQYRGETLPEWKRRLQGQKLGVAELLAQFRSLPEEQAYPLGGLFVDLLVREVGWEQFKAGFTGASAATWVSSCKGAGTTPEALEEAWRKAFARS